MLNYEVRQALLRISEKEPLTSSSTVGPAGGGEELPETAPHLIGLSGKPRSGKDVVADYLIERYASVAKINFSEPIIEEVNQMITPHKITESNKSDSDYRALLQAWGTARREEREDYWVDLLRDRIRSLSEKNRLVVVCGVRALSDLALIEELGGEHWHVERPGNQYKAEHSIESQLDQLDRSQMKIIENPVEDDLAPYLRNIEAALNRGAA